MGKGAMVIGIKERVQTKNTICNRPGSGQETAKLVRNRPVHLLLMERVTGSRQKEGAHGRTQRETQGHWSHFVLTTCCSFTLQRDSLDRQVRDYRQVSKSGAKEKAGWKLRGPVG